MTRCQEPKLLLAQNAAAKLRSLKFILRRRYVYIRFNEKTTTSARLQTTVKKHAMTTELRVFEHENKMKMPKSISSNSTLLRKRMGDASIARNNSSELSRLFYSFISRFTVPGSGSI